LIRIVALGAAVLVLFGFVYRSTASHVRSRSDDTIAAERVLLQRVYDGGGRGELISTIGQRIAEGRLDGGRCLLADPLPTPVAGNLTAWPSALKGADRWETFSDPTADQALLRRASNALSRPLRISTEFTSTWRIMPGLKFQLWFPSEKNSLG
jgi:hypothetical protein